MIYGLKVRRRYNQLLELVCGDCNKPTKEGAWIRAGENPGIQDKCSKHLSNYGQWLSRAEKLHEMELLAQQDGI